MQKILTIVSVANREPTQWYLWYPQFADSLQYFGHEPMILGRAPGEYRGLGSKPKLLKRALDAGRIATEWLLFVDCFDLLFQRDPELCIDLMQEHYPDAEMVIGGELNCFPRPELADQYHDFGTRFRYLNSGFMLARTADFHRFLQDLDPEQFLDDGEVDANLYRVTSNDQGSISELHLKGCRVKTQLDYKAELVVNLCGLELNDLDFRESGEIHVKETKSYPPCIHANGGNKELWHDPILKHLGYPV